MMSAGPQTNQAPMYWMPVVAVPYAANMGQVNLGWSPSQDPYGRDIPHSGGHFLCIYVLILDISCSSHPQYYRMNNPEMGSHVPSGAVMMENCGNFASMGPPVVCADTYVGGGGCYECVNTGYDNLSPVSGGEMVVSKTCGTGHADTNPCSAARSVKNSQDYSANNNNSFASDKNNTRNIANSRACITDQFSIGKSANINVSQENNVDKVNCEESLGDCGKDSQSKENDEDDDVSEGMDVGSDGDSGCPSECADLSPVSGPDSFTASELTQSETGDSTSLLEQTSTDSGKPRGKRRYYMYGNHKLVKPIKEIPLRFQMLLAETSAAKARCEGQPIYMQHSPQAQQPIYDIVYYQTNDNSQAQLNANASCFFPTQDGGGCVESGMTTAYVPECYASGYTNNVAPNQSNHPTCTHAAQAPPLFVPAVSGSSHSTSTQNCQTIIVYSSHSTQATAGQTAPPSPQVRTISMPPPFPPPPNLPPPPLDIISSSTSPLSQTCNQLVRSVATNSCQPKTTAMYADHHIETYNMQTSQVPSKPLGLLNVPPPNLQTQPTLPPSSMAPPTHHNMVSHYSTPTYISVQPPTQAPAPHLNGSVHQLPPPSNHGAPPPGAYPVGSSNHYMYVYPSPPAGQPAPNPHVVYMVSPAYPYNPVYQQQGVLVPSNCPVPVQ
ncbi:unnamed protein product [Lymnaea stagnalis]|uniref:Uncharacterized protein n=1 Tax=Lymnaea stagnalis TaxID=6523 RepID=A0AAV2HVA1_LYMST